MVGKGSLSGGGKTASYGYVVGCDSVANANAPFEVRFGTQRFRLTGSGGWSCSDDPAVATPAAGFDTQTGSGSGTLTTGGPAAGIQWKFVDGGAGGTNDGAQITIKRRRQRNCLPRQRGTTRQVPRLHPANRLQHSPAAALAGRSSAGDTRRAMSQENLELGRRLLDAANQEDRAAWLALSDPDLEWFPPAEWPENAPIRGSEAVWDYIVELNEPWAEGTYELVELIDGEDEKIAARLARHVRGKASGVDAEFEYWNVVTYRAGKQFRSEWFADREEALEAAGLAEDAPEAD